MIRIAKAISAFAALLNRMGSTLFLRARQFTLRLVRWSGKQQFGVALRS